MVRKWSYITLVSQKYKAPKITTFSRFKFKIFRKNTRFKNYSLLSTTFVRRKVALQNRRSVWKNYVLLSSKWVKLVSNQKRITSFSQTKQLFNLAFNEPYTTFLGKNLINLLGVTYNRLSKRFVTKTNNPPQPNQLPTTKHTLTRGVVQCHSVNEVHKLQTLTSLPVLLNYNQNSFYVSSDAVNNPSTNLITKLPPTITLFFITLLRIIYTYSILHKLSRGTNNL